MGHVLPDRAYGRDRLTTSDSKKRTPVVGRPSSGPTWKRTSGVIRPPINTRDPKPPCDGGMCNPQERMGPAKRKLPGPPIKGLVRLPERIM